MLAIIDYGSGNLRSVAKAFERVAPDAQIQVTQSPEVFRQASHIVLPGVGAFADCMQGLAALPGMLSMLEEEVLTRKKYFLGICVGMQMLFETGHEHGTHTGLGWLKGEVVKLSPSETSLKIPHMGWNDLGITQAHPLLANIENGAQAYFVHSYYAICRDESNILATTQYGQTIAAVVARSNIMGTQFHPEKSQKAGLQLLKNFIEM
jgi:imidazole glycerol-phosphate synthase subunit HisH